MTTPEASLRSLSVFVCVCVCVQYLCEIVGGRKKKISKKEYCTVVCFGETNRCDTKEVFVGFEKQKMENA